MRFAPALSISLAFIAGIAVSPAAQRLLPSAQAQAPAVGSPLVPMIIDIAALKDADLPATPNPDLRSKGLVATPNAPRGSASRSARSGLAC